MTAARTLELAPVARLLKALGDETRLRMVALLSQGELCVCHLEAALEQPQPTISRQLATLRAAGVVDSRREGAWVHYRLAPQADADGRQLLSTLVASFTKRTVLRRDFERLVRSRGPGRCS